MKQKLRIVIAIAKGLALGTALAALAGLTSCVPHAYPVGAPNPLDEPGEIQPTVNDLHQQNIRIITGNPGYLMKP
jgi:hypothetical protein